MTLDEMNEKLKTLPNEMVEDFKDISIIVMNAESRHSTMQLNGEITEEQYKTWKECVKCNINLLLM